VIFVTVGSSDFDGLVEKMDDLAPSLSSPVVIQIGYGQYIPKHCRYFRFAPSLDTYYDQAEIIVAHGGLGTTLEVLKKGKRLISVENATCIDDHQADVLSKIAEGGHLVWCHDMNELGSLIQQIPTLELKPYTSPACEIGTVIKDFLGGIYPPPT
jgi:beta-1,4-N-acetylglucosaminyltransferase